MSGSEQGTFTRTRMWRFKRLATRYVDPILRPIVRQLPTFGFVTHRGRKTGRVYHTPVNVFPRSDTYLFFLTYGSDVEWVKNVLASGSCALELGGHVVDLIEPQLITDPELRPAPPLGRFIERRIAGVTQYLRMRSDAPPDSARRRRARTSRTQDAIPGRVERSRRPGL